VPSLACSRKNCDANNEHRPQFFGLRCERRSTELRFERLIGIK